MPEEKQTTGAPARPDVDYDKEVQSLIDRGFSIRKLYKVVRRFREADAKQQREKDQNIA